MSVHLSQLVTPGDYNKAENAFMLNGGGPLVLSFEMLKAGQVFPVVLKNNKFRSDDQSYPISSNVKGDSDTLVVGEDTGYLGDGATLAFTGQVLNHLPVVPFSVKVNYTDSGADAIILYDKKGDGVLYSQKTAYADEVVAGSICYKTGALVLACTAVTEIPAAGAILCDYQYSTLIGSTAMSRIRSIAVFNALTHSREIDVRIVSVTKGSQCRIDFSMNVTDI